MDVGNILMRIVMSLFRGFLRRGVKGAMRRNGGSGEIAGRGARGKRGDWSAGGQGGGGKGGKVGKGGGRKRQEQPEDYM
jgi:hypothetical protein